MSSADADIKKNGLICVLNPAGEVLGKFEVPEYPEITGMQFSRLNHDILYITENSTSPVCVRVLVNNDLLDKTSKDKRNQIESSE